MADFYPTEITQDNLKTAVRENLLKALEALGTKLNIVDPLPLNDINAQGNLVRLVGDGPDDFSACTYSQLVGMLE